MENHGTEMVSEKESESHEDIHLAVIEQNQKETGDMEVAQNGHNDLRSQDVVPHRRNPVPVEVSPQSGVHDIHRPTPAINDCVLAQISARNPTSQLGLRDRMSPIRSERGQNSGLTRSQAAAQFNSLQLDNPPGRDKQALVGSVKGANLLDRQRSLNLRLGESSGHHKVSHADMDLDN